MDRFSRIDWFVALALLALAPGFVLLVGGLGWIDGRMASPAAQAWAAWVQAVGSIGAIVGAAWIAGRQARATLANERRQAAGRIDALARLLVAVKDAVRGLDALMRPGTWQGVGGDQVSAYADGRRFLVLRDAVGRIPLESLGSETAVYAISDIQAGIASLTVLQIDPLQRKQEYLDMTKDGLLRVENFGVALEQHILLLRAEAERLLRGEGPRHAAAAPLSE